MIQSKVIFGLIFLRMPTDQKPDDIDECKVLVGKKMKKASPHFV